MRLETLYPMGYGAFFHLSRKIGYLENKWTSTNKNRKALFSNEPYSNMVFLCKIRKFTFFSIAVAIENVHMATVAMESIQLLLTRPSNCLRSREIRNFMKLLRKSHFSSHRRCHGSNIHGNGCQGDAPRPNAFNATGPSPLSALEVEIYYFL